MGRKIDTPKTLGRNVRLTNVNMTFESEGSGRRTVFDRFDFFANAGDAVAVLGPSGCGKTTLLRLIAGLEFPTNDDAKITVAGELVTGPGPDRGFVFQHYSSFPWLTAEGNVLVPLRRRGLDKEAARTTAREYLELVGLQDYAGSYPRELSGGQQQRVALARTLASEPAVMLLDEPYAALDAQTREAMQAELIELWRRLKPTVIFVTHDIREAIRVGHRIVVLGNPPAQAVLEVESLPVQHRLGLCAASATNGNLPARALEDAYALERTLREALSHA